jgi:hypothetical protein
MLYNSVRHMIDIYDQASICSKTLSTSPTRLLDGVKGLQKCRMSLVLIWEIIQPRQVYLHIGRSILANHGLGPGSQLVVYEHHDERNGRWDIVLERTVAYAHSPGCF